MRIAYDVTPLSHPRTGVGNYILGALRGMVEVARGEHEFVAFGPVSIRGRKVLEEALSDLPVERRLLTVPFAHVTRRAWGALGRPAAERLLGKFDVLHFSDWMLPPQASGLRATMVHDLGPLVFPERLQPRTVRMHTGTARETVNCDLVFTNSEFTSADVAERLRVPQERIRVAYPGVDEDFTPQGELPESSRPYVFTTASREWRKNRGVLESAIAQMDGDLTLNGGLDFVARAELPKLYRGATVFAYPSRFEGFGIPVVEAMACGVPCVVSTHPSLDEACGDAAVRADPESAESFADGIRTALERRDELVARGLAHARRFTWLETGRVHLQSYADAL